MTAVVTNPYKLTWGTFAVGGTTERLIANVHRIRRDHGSFEVELEVVIRGTSDATFAAACAEMESEFSKRRQAILFEVGSSTIHSFNPASGTNTGLNSYARIAKPGTPGGDTDRSRVYVITVGCELPSTDTAGRRDATLVVDYDPAQRRTVTISGVWTAVTTLNATAQYAAQIASYCSSALGALLPAGTFELVSQRTNADDQDKTLQFQRVYREVGHVTGDTILSDANIVEASIGFTRDRTQPGDSGGGGVKRLETITAAFSCYLDKTQSVDLDALYTGTIRPYVKAQFEAQFAPSSYGIVTERPHFVKYANQLNVEITFQAAINATDVVESIATQRIVESSGVVLTGAWTGGIFDKYADQGIGVRRRLGLRTVMVLGVVGPKTRVGTGGTVFGVGFFDPATGQPEPGTYAPGDAVGVGLGGSGWKLIDNDSAATTRYVGQVGEEQLALTTIVEQTVEEYVDAPGGSGVAGAQFSGGSN